MAANVQPIFPVAPAVYVRPLAGVSACATRGPTATASLATANIFELTPTTTNGLRVDRITVSGASTAIGQDMGALCIGIWIWDGTTAFLYDEIVTTTSYPSATAKAGHFSTTYDALVLPATYKLYCSVGTATLVGTNACTVTAIGGIY